MDINELIISRRSIRAFQKKMPPRKHIHDCIEAATWAPNATNQQPWEFIVATGKELETLIDVNSEHFAESMQGSDPFSGMPEPCEIRQQETMTKMIQVAQDAGIDPNDIFQQSLRFFNAPIAVYFINYKLKKHNYRLSTAAALENFILAAHAKGLGTCWLNVTIMSQEDLRNHLGIQENKEIIGSIAVGYPIADSPLNTFTRTRVPVDEVTTWLGFEP